jgi:hypothetical protein
MQLLGGPLTPLPHPTIATIPLFPEDNSKKCERARALGGILIFATVP